MSKIFLLCLYVLLDIHDDGSCTALVVDVCIFKQANTDVRR